MGILKKMKKKYYSINQHRIDEIREQKEREWELRQLEELVNYLKIKPNK